VLEETVGSNTTERYVWSPVYIDAMVLRDRDTDANGTLDERLWVQQDANFNVTALVDGTGAVVERYGYDPFGVRTVYDSGYSVRSGGSSYDFLHGFQGMAFDAIAGLNPQRFRWYSPTLGRWVSVDPIGFAGGDTNQYGFLRCNPINQTDPSGLCPSGQQPAKQADEPITDVGEIQKIIFGMKLQPKGDDADIARSNSGCVGFVNGVCLTKEEFTKRFNEFLKKTPNDPLEAFGAAVSPETLPGVKCFKSLDDAKKVKVPEGKTKIIFRKCGEWAGGKAPDGQEVPINSIVGAIISTNWDYAVLHDGMWTNVQNPTNKVGIRTDGPQIGYHGKDEPMNDKVKWPDCMYCVFLKDAKKGK
jgi:RHS repeat-associated protein